MTKPEGVAAPLEPTKLSPEEYLKEWDSFSMIGPGRPYSYWMGFAEAYAAAVSKNLTDKYAELEAKWTRELLTVSNEIDEAREELTESKYQLGVQKGINEYLRREITALRETKI